MPTPGLLSSGFALPDGLDPASGSVVSTLGDEWAPPDSFRWFVPAGRWWLPLWIFSQAISTQVGPTLAELTFYSEQFGDPAGFPNPNPEIIATAIPDAGGRTVDYIFGVGIGAHEGNSGAGQVRYQGFAPFPQMVLSSGDRIQLDHSAGLQAGTIRTLLVATQFDSGAGGEPTGTLVEPLPTPNLP